MSQQEDFEEAFGALGYNLTNSGKYCGGWTQRYDAEATRHAANGWEGATERRNTALRNLLADNLAYICVNNLAGAENNAAITQGLAALDEVWVWRFDRYRRGQRMAEGGKVHAKSSEEARSKVRALFERDADPGELEVTTFVLVSVRPASSQAAMAQKDSALGSGARG
jgi:hypothetical protein